jgi:molybdopterin/thiamine biosynthesis adenylyltransferase
VVIGCGNIGSFLVLLLARLAEIAKLTLVDFDVFSGENCASQNASPADAGKPKARVLARLARRLSPGLSVVPLVARVENVPPGLLRSDVILAGLDSKDARRRANEVAWHLGVPLVDAGVEASAMLARVNVYQPAASQPCLQCAWDQRDYDSLPVIHSCSADAAAAPATGAPACLGALAASLQAIECRKILAGDFSTAGKQILLDAATNKHFVTSFRRNPCRFNHEIWDLSKSPVVAPGWSVSEVLKLSGPGRATLAFAGMSLARQLACPGCGYSRPVLRLESRFSPREKNCPRCGRGLLPPGFHSLASLNDSELDHAIGARSLASLGLREGDVISVACGNKEQIFELGPARAFTGAGRQPVNRRTP